MLSRFSLTDLPMVGRREAQAALLEGLEAAQAGFGRTLFLTGELGAGKSHALRRLRAEAERRGFQIAAARAYRAEHSVSFATAAEAFLPLLRSRTAAELAVLTGGSSADLALLFPGLEDEDHPHLPPEPGTFTELRARAFWTLAEFLSACAARAPILVSVDDLQWADRSSLELLHLLSRRLAGAPVLFLFSRDDPLPTGAAHAGEMERSLVESGAGEQLPLPLLTAAETADLLEVAFGTGAVPPDFSARLHEWTKGNPFYLGECLEQLIADGTLRRKGEFWVGWERAHFQVPSSVREVMTRRISTLEDDARSLLERAAVLGREVPLGLLKAFSSVPEHTLLEVLERLVAADLLTEEKREEEFVYAFRVPLLREVLLAEMGRPRKQALHAEAARILENHLAAASPNEAAVLRERLAHHCLEAGADAPPNAFSHLLAAGRQALARFGSAEAEAFLSAAVAYLRPEGGDSRGEAELLISALADLARARRRLGRLEEAERLWTEVAQRASASGLELEAAWSEFERATLENLRGQPARALERVGRVLTRPAARADPSLNGAAQVLKALSLLELGRPREAEEAIRALLAAQEGTVDPASLAEAHRLLVLLYVWTGNPQRVRDHAEQALAWAARSGARSVAFWTSWGLAMWEGLRGNTAAMAGHLQECRRVAEEIRSPHLLLRIQELEIEFHAARGDWDLGLREGERAIATAESLADLAILPRLLVWTALIYLGRGEIELARPLIERAWTLSGNEEKEPPQVHRTIPAYIGRGYLALATGEYPEAIRLGTEALEIADRAGYRLWALHRLLPLVAEASLWARDLSTAKRIGERLREESSALGHRLGLAWAESCDALVTWLEGDPARGAKMMERAAQKLEAIPMLGDAARLRRMRAGRLADIGDRDGALAELERVHALFLRLGAERELEKTRGMFRELGERPPRRSAGEDGALSPREREIAYLIEQRKSNKAIAKALGITPRTVGTHLTNIYRKLGLHTRAELADYVRRSALEKP